jgi:hypothetical protein
MKLQLLILIAALNILPEMAKAAPGPIPEPGPDAFFVGGFGGLGGLGGLGEFGHGGFGLGHGLGLGWGGLLGRDNGWGLWGYGYGWPRRGWGWGW